MKKPVPGRDGISTLKRTHKCTHPYASVHTPACTCMCAHAQTYTYMRAHTHIHTCTHMHRQNGQDSGAPMARGKKKDTDNPDTQSNALVQTFFPKKKIELPLDAFYAM